LDIKEYCNAYVVFKQKESLEKAISDLNGKVFEGRHLCVDHAEIKIHHSDHNRSLFVGNLPFDVDDEELWALFKQRQKAPVQRVRVVRDPETQHGKGFGYIMLQDIDSVKDMVKRATRTPGAFTIRDRELRLSISKRNVKAKKDQKNDEKETKKKAYSKRKEKPWQGMQADQETFLQQQDKKKNRKHAIKSNIKKKNKT
jgi:nucleolar protein 12